MSMVHHCLSKNILHYTVVIQGNKMCTTSMISQSAVLRLCKTLECNEQRIAYTASITNQKLLKPVMQLELFGIIYRAFHLRHTQLLWPAYQLYVLPILMHCSFAWSPFLQKDIRAI